MIVVAEMRNGGTFEAQSRKKLIEKMINYFGENDRDAGQIKALYVVFKNNTVDELCKEAVRKTQDAIDEGTREWRKIAEQEYRGQMMIEQEYYANLI